MLRIVIGFIKFYRYFISPWLGKNCRFLPTCSEYGIIALRKYGVKKGILKTIQRLLRCHPWSTHSVDDQP